MRMFNDDGDKRWWRLLATLLLVLVLAACGRNDTAESDSTAPDEADANLITAPAATEASPVEEDAEPASDEAAGETEMVEEPVTDEEVAAETAVDAIIAAFPDPPQTAGDIIIIYGQVKDVNGNPLPGVAVEFWQTDNNGVYDHPNDPGTNGRDPNFQFYGTSVTDDTGTYSFRTIKPAAYEPRPSHIHVKVKMNGAEVLTTQFYFAEDRAVVEGEGLFRQAGDLGELLLVTLEDGTGAAGNPIRTGHKDIVIDTGIGAGALALTPFQGQGPFSPVVTVADFDNDLTTLP